MSYPCWSQVKRITFNSSSALTLVVVFVCDFILKLSRPFSLSASDVAFFVGFVIYVAWQALRFRSCWLPCVSGPIAIVTFSLDASYVCASLLSLVQFIVTRLCLYSSDLCVHICIPSLVSSSRLFTHHCHRSLASSSRLCPPFSSLDRLLATRYHRSFVFPLFPMPLSFHLDPPVMSCTPFFSVLRSSCRALTFPSSCLMEGSCLTAEDSLPIHVV